MTLSPMGESNETGLLGLALAFRAGTAKTLSLMDPDERKTKFLL